VPVIVSESKTFKDKMGFAQTRFVDKLFKEAVEEINKLIIPGDIHSDTFRKMLMTTSNYESEIVDKVLEIYQTHENPNIRLENCPTLPVDQIVQTKEIVFPGNYGKDIFTPAHPGILNVPVEAKCPVVIVDGVVNMVIVNKLISAFTGHSSVVLFARSFEPIALSSFQSINGQGATKVIPFKVEAAGSLGSNILSELGQLLGVTPVISLDEIYDRKNVEIPSVSFLLTTQGVMFTKEDKTINERAESILSELVPRYEKMNVIDKQTPIGLSLFTRISRLRANNVTIKSIEGKIVMHKCDNPACINPEHLELGTYQSNMADKIAKGRLDKTKYQGTANGRAKLTEDDIRAIRSRFYKETADGLAAEFGVTFSAIYRIATKVTWKHVI
jgi:hypothetical protein